MLGLGLKSSVFGRDTISVEQVAAKDNALRGETGGMIPLGRVKSDTTQDKTANARTIWSLLGS